MSFRLGATTAIVGMGAAAVIASAADPGPVGSVVLALIVAILLLSAIFDTARTPPRRDARPIVPPPSNVGELRPHTRPFDYEKDDDHA